MHVGRLESDGISCVTRMNTLNARYSEVTADGLEKYSITNSEGLPSGSGTPPLKRKSKLASIGKIFKPWKWRKKKASEKFQETSALLERKISTRQSREELIRRGVLKEVAEQDGNAETTCRNGHTIHAVPITLEPTAESMTEAGSTNPAPPLPDPETPEGCLVCTVQTSQEAQPSPLPVPHLTVSTLISAAAEEVEGVKPSPQPVLKCLSVPPKPICWSKNVEHEACDLKVLPNLLSSPQSPSQLHSEVNTDQAQDLSRFPGTGDTHRNSGKHSDFPTQPQSLRLGESDSFGLPAVTHLVPEPGDHDEKTKARTEKSEKAADQQVDQPDLSQQQSVKKGASPTLPGKPDVTDGEGNMSEQQAEKDLTTTEETEKGSCDEVDRSEKSETAVSPLTKKTHVQLDSSSLVTVIPNVRYRESLGSDSDSDSSLQDKTESDESDEDEECLNSALANKIRRRDTLAIKLRNRPTKQELEEKNILPRKSDEERMELRQQIGTKLIRRLSQRPSLEELEQRNILRYRNEEEEHEERLEIRRRLTRKLSLRPTVAELQARRILRFNEYVEVTEAQDYDRRADKPWTRLTPADKAAIRKELNEFKSREMEVHEESRHLTRFHRP
ncbi:phosphatase and actin regulator 2 isoform X2 [Rhincodon typus]|uniref:phosphatase and actin regulator 2 isoform X2 n=1 Tax=Rhincodon typus TaxID=259920 RepID=UPI002030BCC0|nr:phosphatase and actin regulator 2 isoform X2 [Rhincodon typus]